MTTWHEYVQETGSIPEWPYPIRYGKERIISTDVPVSYTHLTLPTTPYV